MNIQNKGNFGVDCLVLRDLASGNLLTVDACPTGVMLGTMRSYKEALQEEMKTKLHGGYERSGNRGMESMMDLVDE